MTHYLHDRYRKEILPALQREFSYANVMQIPRVRKVVLNVGLGEALLNAKALDATTKDITAITGQKPVITRSPVFFFSATYSAASLVIEGSTFLTFPVLFLYRHPG